MLQPPKKCVVLIGYMCAGKTTVGKALAKKIGRTFYDLDWYIEERFHKKVPAIFAENGEEKFRDIERRMLHEAAEFENTILSCGGGTPCFYDNIDYMNEVADTYYLKASTDTILQHLSISKGERPLLKGKSPEELRVFIDEQLAKRAPFYEKAHHIIDVNVLDDFDKIDQIVDTIIEAGGLQGTEEASHE